MKKNRNKLLPAAIILIVVANLIVWGYVIFIKQKSGNALMIDAQHGLITKKIKLPDFKLEDNTGKFITIDHLSARLNILIFFTFDDCATCLFEAEFWGEAAKDFHESDVNFLGVTVENDKDAVQEFNREYGILFPVAIDRDGGLKEKIRSELKSLKMNLTTPFKIFVNSNHEIIHIEKPTKDVEQQKLFSGRVSRILKMNGK